MTGSPCFSQGGVECVIWKDPEKKARETIAKRKKKKGTQRKQQPAVATATHYVYANGRHNEQRLAPSALLSAETSPLPLRTKALPALTRGVRFFCVCFFTAVLTHVVSTLLQDRRKGVIWSLVSAELHTQTHTAGAFMALRRASPTMDGRRVKHVSSR